jgi:hypothetical protein
MSLTLAASKSALAAGLKASFLANGGTEPYTYSVLPDGAGGTINASSGLYTAPALLSSNPSESYDRIQVTDSTVPTPATAVLPILVTDALGLFCDIIQKEMNLDNGRVFFWDQKISQPKDNGLYVAITELSPRPFGNTNRQVGNDDGLDSVQSLNMRSTLQVSLISRGPEARTRKAELIMALMSNYSQQQQVANSFSIGRLPPGGQFVNLSNIDGAAIPYRYDIAVSIQYLVRKIKPVAYIDDFESVSVTPEA